MVDVGDVLVMAVGSGELYRRGGGGSNAYSRVKGLCEG